MTFNQSYNQADVVGDSITVQHNLDTKWLHCTVWLTRLGNIVVEPEQIVDDLLIEQVDANAIRIVSPFPGHSQFRIQVRVSK